VPDERGYERVGSVLQWLGMGVSPDDCSLALRGMQTLAVRLDALQKSTLAVARWLADRPEIERVLHPALPSCPGHELWHRDFTGSTSIFSIVFREKYSKEQILRFIDELELFEIGYSWGGVTSLAVPHFAPPRNKPVVRANSLVRLNIGLERTEDLLADLEHALATLR
jgi:cystathionine beta-lyase